MVTMPEALRGFILEPSWRIEAGRALRVRGRRHSGTDQITR